MKKTLKFDDGSVLVGSGSTFTVTQEDLGKLDIFDMPSKYIWISNRDTLDGADEIYGDIYIGIWVTAGSKRYTLTVLDLQPFKYENIKCKVIERTETEDAVAFATLSDGTKETIYGDLINFNNRGDIVKIDCIQPVIQLWLNSVSNLTEVNLKGVTEEILVTFCNKLTKITSDRPISPSSISIKYNPELLSLPEFKPAVYSKPEYMFVRCPKLDMDTSAFQFSGLCSNVFLETGIKRLVINDAGITAMLSFAQKNTALQEVVINGTLNKCKYFTFAFKDNTNLKKCDMSGVTFENATKLSHMFENCTQLTTVRFNYATMGNGLKDVSYMFEKSGITDDIIFSNTAIRLSDIDYLCSPQTKKLVFADNSILGEINIAEKLENAVNLEYLEIPNYGSNLALLRLNLGYCKKLGTGSEENLQAFKNFFTNAFDRKTAGYAVSGINIASAQKALLTAEEITAFENKGYKIA